MSPYKAYTYADTLRDIQRVMDAAQCSEADAIEALLDTDTVEEAIKVATYRKEGSKVNTIKRQNLSGDWFITDGLNEEEAKILFDHYCDGPFQNVELWSWGSQWHLCFNKNLNKIFECWNGTETPTS